MDRLSKAVERAKKAILDSFEFTVLVDEILDKYDLVDVVRCKDCKHSYEDLDSRVCVYGRCLNCDVSDDWFCADGERRYK